MFRDDTNDTLTHVNNILVPKMHPRVLCKRNSANNNLVHGVVAEASVHKTEHIPVDACNDVRRPSAVDKDHSVRSLLIEFPEPGFLLPSPREG